jgi:glycine cleavage system regulatory protein
MEPSYIITFIGDDRPGLVEELAKVIESNGGNWLESRLSQLGGKFAGLISISLPSNAEAQLESGLSALSSSGLSVRVTATGAGASPAPGQDIILSIIGPDRVGIVREISHALTQRQVNVLKMNSEVSHAPMSAEQIFKADIEARIPADTIFEDLRDALDEIADQMTLDIDLE